MEDVSNEHLKNTIDKKTEVKFLNEMVSYTILVLYTDNRIEF